MTSAPDPIAALRASHDRLKAVVTPLTPAQLRQRGYPSEWSIAQVLSHLGSGAEISTLVVDAGLAGAEAPARELYPPIWDRWNNKSPDDQAADAIDSDSRLVERIEANADSKATFQTFIGPADIRGLAAGRIGEHAVHTWDVAVAVDPSAKVLPEAVEIIVDGVARLIGWVAKPSSWRGVVKVTTSGPDRELALTIGEPSTMEPWSDDRAAPDATLVVPAEAFIRLLYGRLDADHTPAGITTSGITLDELRSVFPGF
jgi:uncharacterized protein (TIGR03083 family)